MDGRTNGRTDGPTDGPIDQQTYRQTGRTRRTHGRDGGTGRHGTGRDATRLNATRRDCTRPDGRTDGRTDGQTDRQTGLGHRAAKPHSFFREVPEGVVGGRGFRRGGPLELRPSGRELWRSKRLVFKEHRSWVLPLGHYRRMESWSVL